METNERLLALLTNMQNTLNEVSAALADAVELMEKPREITFERKYGGNITSAIVRPVSNERSPNTFQ